MRRVVVVGGGVARFGRREATYRDLISEAGKAAFDDIKNIKPNILSA
jgi:acetyl-CoA C-acetyltransferase